MPVVEGPIIKTEWMPDAAELGAGAVVTVDGVVRASNNGRDDVTGIFYDGYREMADRAMADIYLEIRRMYPVSHIEVVHRIGDVPVGELSLFVIAASAHRVDAFAACQMAVDELKRRAPLWKKERYTDDSAQWI